MPIRNGAEWLKGFATAVTGDSKNAEMVSDGENYRVFPLTADEADDLIGSLTDLTMMISASKHMMGKEDRYYVQVTFHE